MSQFLLKIYANNYQLKNFSIPEEVLYRENFFLYNKIKTNKIKKILTINIGVIYFRILEEVGFISYLFKATIFKYANCLSILLKDRISLE